MPSKQWVTEALGGSEGMRGGEAGDLLIPRLYALARVMSDIRNKGCGTKIKCIVFKYSPSHFVYLSLNSSPLNLSPLH